MAKYLYYKEYPRGFANEYSYYRILASRKSEIDKYFEGYKDAQFDAGNTGWAGGWTDDLEARLPYGAVDWDDALSMSAWGTV